MSCFLLDTNVVSELRRPRPDTGVVGWIDAVRSSDLRLSVLTVGEITQGIERLALRDVRQAKAIAEWRDRLVNGYGDRIAPVSREVAEAWGRLNAYRPLPVIDGLLAATAVVHDWTLVTRDSDAVTGIGVKLLNPFSASG
ncbi:type II toxin-antitoxin system VapC family toxin [Kribbella albertanoniae]|uniref:Ribonuclease VapC n=1 Tax=Kribbella albertanoniae TaxID=1266829 RepID=A0A4R4QGJ4_9ACTN|nr:type II toxin-antitoxin system VapC family toxin [Kribbella albertanoniae]TDC34323.1 type II toxin-antitoxin system VapC family toxin [Kribbella albertanoniae]